MHHPTVRITHTTEYTVNDLNIHITKLNKKIKNLYIAKFISIIKVFVGGFGNTIFVMKRTMCSFV